MPSNVCLYMLVFSHTRRGYPKNKSCSATKIRPLARKQAASKYCISMHSYSCRFMMLRDKHVRLATASGTVHVVGTRDTQKRLSCAGTQEQLVVRGALRIMGSMYSEMCSSCFKFFVPVCKAPATPPICTADSHKEALL